MKEQLTEAEFEDPEAIAVMAFESASLAQNSGDIRGYDLAGLRYESAFKLFPEDKKPEKIAAAKSSIKCFKKANSLEAVVRVSTELLSNYSSEISTTDRAEISDLVHLTKLRLGQE